MTPRGLRWAVGGRPPRTPGDGWWRALRESRAPGHPCGGAQARLRLGLRSSAHPPHHATSQAARSRTQLLRHPSPKRNTLTADLATRPPPAADTWRTTRPRARGGASVAGPATLPFCSHTSSPPGPKRPPDRRAWRVRDQDLQRRDEAASASAGAATSHKDFRPPPPLRPGSAAAASARDACARYLHTGAVTAQPPLRDVEKRTFKTDRGCLRRAPSHSCLLLPVPPTPGCGDRGKGPKTPKLDLNLQSAGDFVLRDIIF